MKAVEEFIEYLENHWKRDDWEGLYRNKGKYFIQREKELANQQVIEELERLIEMQGDLVPKYGDIIYERDVKKRIEELKQE